MATNRNFHEVVRRKLGVQIALFRRKVAMLLVCGRVRKDDVREG